MPSGFNAGYLLNDFKQLCLDYSRIGYGELSQINICIPKDVMDGPRPHEGIYYVSGTNWDFSRKQPIRPEDDFTEIIPALTGTYTEHVINSIRSMGTRIGRVRYLTQMPKTCLSWHTDSERQRFHIPLITNEACFFVSGDTAGVPCKVETMPEAGGLYVLQTNIRHTSVNAHIELPRTHIVINILP